MTESRRSAHRSRARRKGVRTLFTLAALFAVFLQALAVQTHVHAYGFASAPIAAQVSGGNDALDDSAHASVAHAQTLCVICQALASSGRALVPEAPVIAFVASATSAVAAIEIRDAPRAIAHAWQSRAPPTAL
jgi:hypothetical protein